MNIIITGIQTSQFRDGLSNIVEYVLWTAADGSTSVDGMTRVGPPTDNFTPLENLSEDSVLAWVKGRDGARIKKLLREARDKDMKATLPPPWSDGFEYQEPESVRIARQTYAYNEAVKRLSQYVVAEGRLEITEMQPTGEQMINEDTGELEAVMVEVVVQTAIDPVEPTIEQPVYDDTGNQTGTENVTNPLIVQDEAERAAAQAVIDATPEEIKQ